MIYPSLIWQAKVKSKLSLPDLNVPVGLSVSLLIMTEWTHGIIREGPLDRIADS